MAEPIVETRCVWPGGARCAVVLSFDFDAEMLRVGRARANRQRSDVLSHGRYGANPGVQMVLDTLEDSGAFASLFDLVTHSQVTDRQIADAWAAREGKSP